MGELSKKILRNKTLYWIAAAFICLQGLLCVNQIIDGCRVIGSAADMMYYDTGGAVAAWGLFMLLTGLAALAGFIVFGIAAFSRNPVLAGIGTIVIAGSYLLAMIREIISHFLYGGIGFFFLNMLGLALFIVLLITVLGGARDLRKMLLEYTPAALLVPMGLFVLTAIVAAAGFGLSTATFFYNLAEDLALSAVILVTAVLLAEEAPGRATSETFERGKTMQNRNNAGGGDPFATSGSIQAPEGYRSVALVVIFGIITCGIYLFYWVYKVSEIVNRELMTGKSPMAQMLLFIFVPFYSWYWIYTISQGLNEYGFRQGRNPDTSLPMINLIVTIVGFSIVAVAIMQDMLNKIVGAFEGERYGGQSGSYGQYGQASGTGYGQAPGAGYGQAPGAQQGAETGANAAAAAGGTYAGASVGGGYYYAAPEAAGTGAAEEPEEAAEEAAGPEGGREWPEPEAEQEWPETVPAEEAAEEAPAAEFEAAESETAAGEPEEAPAAEEAPATESKAAEADRTPRVPYEELRRLKELLDDGIITQEEFDGFKKKFL